MIPTIKEKAELIGDARASEPNFPIWDPGRYRQVDLVGQVDPTSAQIYVRRDTLGRLVAEGELSTEVERGGMLIGDIFENPTGGRRIVEISDLSASRHTRATEVSLHFTQQSWQVHQREMCERFPDRRVVGWYHTHLARLTLQNAERQEESEETGLFFSRDDMFLHQMFFPEEWHVAMVLNPQGCHAFFRWKDSDIMRCKGYHVFEASRSPLK